MFEIDDTVPFFVEAALVYNCITKYTDGYNCEAYIFDNPNVGN